MSNNIANLAVMLSANSSQYVGGMQRAGVATQRFSATANTSLASVGTAMATLGRAAMRLAPILGAALTIRGLTNELERLDLTAKTAKKLGTTVEDLSRLEFAAEQTGVEVTVMHKAMQRMVQGIGEASTGVGEAKDAIESLGLSAADLREMTPTDAFAALSDAMANVTNENDRLNIAIDLFGNRGAAMVNTMALGSKGLAQMGAQSDDLGRTMQTKTTDAAEELTDAINEMKSALAGSIRTLVSEALPALKAFVNVLTSAFASLKKINVETVENAVQIGAIVIAFTKISSIAVKLIAMGPQIIAMIKGVTKAATIMQVMLNPAGLVKVVAGLAAAVAAGAMVVAAFDGIAEAAEKPKEAIEEVRATIQKLTDLGALRESDLFIGQSVAPFAENIASDVISEFHKIEDAMADAASRAASIFEAMKTPAEKTADKLAEIDELMQLGLLNPETARRAIAQLNEAARPRDFNQQVDPQMISQRVSFAAMGAEGAAGRAQDKIEKNTAEEVKESKRQTAALAELLKIGRNDQGAAVTIVRF